MNKKLLCAALIGGLGLAQAASAQEFDDRWFVTGSAGINLQDTDRGTENGPFGTVGFGKFLTPRVSLETELNYQNMHKEINNNLWWTQYGASLDARYHFRNADSKFWPYLRAGLGWQRHEEEFNATPSPNSPGKHKDSNLAVNLGAGLQFDFGRVNLRTEVGTRVDFDDQQARIGSQQDQFADTLVSLGLTAALGPEPVAAVAPAPAPAPQQSCADQDDDGDGVNNCNDKCPNSQAGQTIGPDGCPVPVSIDLKGVNFDFDKASLRPDAVAILNEAAEILKRYPDLKVEVAGHTDQCGKEGYNQTLSEKRAKTVYDFLTSNGVDAARLSGPNGYGFSRPLEDKGTNKLPGCKSEKNRRTELNSL